jgi:hypothetical protein
MAAADEHTHDAYRVRRTQRRCSRAQRACGIFRVVGLARGHPQTSFARGKRTALDKFMQFLNRKIYAKFRTYGRVKREGPWRSLGDYCQGPRSVCARSRAGQLCTRKIGDRLTDGSGSATPSSLAMFTATCFLRGLLGVTVAARRGGRTTIRKE